MSLRAKLRPVLAPVLKSQPALWQAARDVDLLIDRSRHAAARMLPVLIRPEPRRLQIAITAHCNLACIGCRYGRDFMVGSQLELPMVLQLLDDAREAGFWDVRLYGGEPLLHPQLPKMVAHGLGNGLNVFVTTNGMLLGRKFAALYDAGLRHITIGYYGTGLAYDAYVQRKDRFVELERNIRMVRDRHGDEIDIQINWLLMRPSCTVEALDAACEVALRYGLRIQVDLVHYSLPYFSEGPERELQFRPQDRPAIELVVKALEARAVAHPQLFRQSMAGFRSIPDWLLLGPDMKVACDSHQMIWVGADGSVQQCYVTFPLGNLHEQRLSEMLYSPAHRQAARDSFQLNCPNCHCNYDKRVDKDFTAARRYSAGG
jgi:cyclic pyranopterin phosphate synthase